ncbi:hypothetical protein EVAR_96672_1 [Eumeta japonica]|uniref:Uncharacterized protein n=1 Tax=Eumeta variegata TaxID=151549 RepID=A0A4C1WG70_EUMVA|nr:hypothetical protein EVAR_96672_1 [Eumeta japonica]
MLQYEVPANGIASNFKPLISDVPVSLSENASPGLELDCHAADPPEDPVSRYKHSYFMHDQRPLAGSISPVYEVCRTCIRDRNLRAARAARAACPVEGAESLFMNN